MPNWSQLIPESLDLPVRLEDVSLEKIKALPLYVKLGAGAVILGLVALLANRRGRKRKLPPGPRGIPLLGALHQLSRKMEEDLERLRKTYGDVFSFKISTSLWVAVNGYPAIKEAFINNAEDFAGRPPFGFEDMVDFKDEIFMTDYDAKWKANKKFAMVSLRKFGFGTKQLEPKVLDEISEMIQKIKAEGSKGIDLTSYMCFAMTHVIMSITLFGDREPTDEETKELIHHSLQFFTVMFGFNNNEAFGAAVALLPVWLTKLLFGGVIKSANDVREAFFEFIRKRIEAHQVTIDPDRPRDTLDVYISKRLGQGMTMKELIQTIIIFLPDAIHTLSNVTSYAMRYITHNTKVQDRIHEELDRVVGAKGPVTLEHKASLPYLQATLLEADRIANSFPIAAPHKATRDTTLLGYDVPKDTIIIPNLHSVHYDDDIFPNPHEFDPGHFLDGDGQVKNMEYCIPFSVGRRMCLGESLAKMEKFLFVANLYHEFRFSFPPEQPNPPLEAASIAGAINFPKPYKLCAAPRL